MFEPKVGDIRKFVIKHTDSILPGSEIVGVVVEDNLSTYDVMLLNGTIMTVDRKTPAKIVKLSPETRAMFEEMSENYIRNVNLKQSVLKIGKELCSLSKKYSKKEISNAFSKYLRAELSWRD